MSARVFPIGSGLALRLAAVLAAVLASGCIGSIGPGEDSVGGGGGGGSNEDPPVPSTDTFDCEGGLVPDEVPLKRLSRTQLINTVSDLVRFALPGDQATQNAVIGALATDFALLPREDREGPNGEWGGFTRIDQAVHQEHVESGYAIAVKLGAELARSGRRTAAAGSCATDGDAGNDDACLDAFIRRFGERALRRAVTEDDVAFYREPAGAPPFDEADWADVIALLVASPNSLYFVEHGDAVVRESTETYALDAYELASRLSYQFWQSAPDDELFELARSGALLDADSYAAQVERVFAEPRTTEAVRTFYAEWFEREDVAQINSRVGTPAFDTLRGDFMPSGNLRGAMFDEVADMATYYSIATQGHLEDLYTTTKSFATSAELAGLYGVPVWDGSSEPPEHTQPRSGLLTAAAMVASGSAATRPIMKGVFIRRALLCDPLPPPPADVMATTPEIAAMQTARETVTSITSPDRCVGCHTIINGLGFATENFDSLGRFRDEELLISPETGDVLESRPADSSSVPYVLDSDDAEVSDARELQDAMLESGKVDSCFARTYFRFTFGRAEDVVKDGCALADLHAALKGGEPLESVLRRVALSPAFRQRSFGDVE
jgi:hypothetical protein